MRSASLLFRKAWPSHHPRAVFVPLQVCIEQPWSSFQNDIGPAQTRGFSTSLPAGDIAGKYDDFVYPNSPNITHNDLKSFLDDAERSGVDKSSATFLGTHFEYTSLLALQRLGFQLQRVGGASDCGIDLLGTWHVPSVHFPITVLVQCKTIQKPGPNLIRELEGSFAAAPAGWRGTDSLGVLVVQGQATKGMREAMGRSHWPMACVSCTRAGRVEQMTWNQLAENKMLGGMGVTTRHTGDGGEELVMTFKGRHLTDFKTASKPGNTTTRPSR